ncbi:lysophospholipid acyltransferase family protein [Sunxiuqinia sp. sy24]|uniref:lysophospholipid acyltransferase family protein n=1 Tax=Sunxiuqinia sp. sy24 TaxID=3461495 RepID=UPI004045EBE6
MRKLSNYTGFTLLTLSSLLPFWVLYAISDIFYFLVFYIIKYRKMVVFENLTNSFPEKSDEEIDLLARKYFNHLGDMLIESFKLKTVSAKTLKKRLVVTNPELVNRYFEEGKSVLVLTMHYNNWEWNAILPNYLRHKCLMVYNPARNPTWDSFINRMRQRFGVELVSTKKILRTLLSYEKQHVQSLTWLCADQCPQANTRFWTRFLNQDAGFFPGPEVLAHHTNSPVLFQHMEKTKRGYYQSHFEVLAENPASLQPDELLHRYVQKLEEVIQARPEFYLWSHRRWKHQRPAISKQ